MLLAQFHRYLKSERRLSPHTVEAYVSDLNQLTNYLIAVYDIQDLSKCETEHLRSWLVHLMGIGIAPTSLRRKRTVVNRFYEFALREGHIQANPALKTTLPKQAMRLPKHLRLNQIDQLIRHMPPMVDYPSARDNTLMLMLLHTGMRRAEIIGLDLDDVRLSERSIRVLGKRNKVRMVPMTQALVTTCTRYLDYRQTLYSEDRAFFLTNKANRMYPKFVYNIVKRYIGLVSQDGGLSPHSLRHTFATLMLDQGADINAIKELLGHADLNATQIYTHTSIEKLKSAYRSAHPRS